MSFSWYLSKVMLLNISMIVIWYSNTMHIHIWLHLWNILHIIPWRWKVKIIFLSFHGWWLQAVKAAVRANKAGEIFINDWTMGKIATLPETNIAPTNDGFPIGISFSRGVFSGAMLVSRMVSKLGDGNSNTFYFYPENWGRHPIWLNLTNIFQMGWFNHQLVSDRYLVQDFAIWFILYWFIMNGVEAKHIVVLNVRKLVLQRRYCFGGDVEDVFCILPDGLSSRDDTKVHGW